MAPLYPVPSYAPRPRSYSQIMVGAVAAPTDATIPPALAAGVGTVTGALTATPNLSGSATGVGTATGAATAASLVAGATTGTGTTVGAPTAASQLSGSAAGVGTTTGILVAQVRGSSAGAGATTGAFTATPNLSGTGAGVAAAAGAVTATSNLAGSVTGVGTVTGAATAASTLSGSVAGIGAATGALVTAAQIVGTMAGAGTVTGSPDTTQVYVAAGAAGTALSGDVTVPLPAGLQTSDVLVLSITALDNVDCVVTVSGGAGDAWTRKVAHNNGTQLRLEVWWKRRGASDTDTSVTVTHPAGGKTIVRAHAVRVPGLGDPFAGSSGPVSVSAATAGSFPDIATTTDSTFLFYALSYAEDFTVGPAINDSQGLTLVERDETGVA